MSLTLTRNANFPSLAMLNGRPGIAFRDYLTGRLKIALATTADGQGEWRVQDQDTSLSPEAGAEPGVIDGRPAVAFQTHGFLRVRFRPPMQASGRLTAAGRGWRAPDTLVGRRPAGDR